MQRGLTMKRKRISRKMALVSFCATLCAGACFVAWMSPKSKAAYFLLRVAYASPVSKKALLQTFRSRLWEHGGGYTPPEADNFFCSRLEASASQEEIDAIASFYASQAQGRETARMMKLSDVAREKVVASIMRDLDNYDVWTRGRALLLVEELRSGKIIWKGSFAPTDEAQALNWTNWWQKRGAAQVTALYRKWWDSDSSWKTKQAINPLAGSGIEAIGP